jgi:hypothetical protein
MATDPPHHHGRLLTPEEIRDRVGDSFSQALSGEGEMVTRWVALVEVLDTDGQRAVYSLASSDAKAWDTLGLLTYGVQLEQAAAVRDD